MYVPDFVVLSSYLPVAWQRVGMAHLLGQLGLPPQPDIALPLLHHAATLATIQVARSACVYGLLLLGELSQAIISLHLFSAVLPPGVSPQLEACKRLERTACLNFSPAQYKLSRAYEFAEPPYPFNAMLSVQYYSLASQQGEAEADMALSKWFLCGAESAFDKDGSLAYTFVEKAARKGLPSAEFALGYYAEVGVGRSKDIGTARRWYQRVTLIIFLNWPILKRHYFTLVRLCSTETRTHEIGLPHSHSRIPTLYHGGNMRFWPRRCWPGSGHRLNNVLTHLDNVPPVDPMGRGLWRTLGRAHHWCLSCQRKASPPTPSVPSVPTIPQQQPPRQRQH